MIVEAGNALAGKASRADLTVTRGDKQLAHEDVDLGPDGFAETLIALPDMAPGKYPTAHYALATGVMALGNSAAGYYSGQIETFLGYQHFFVWVLCSAVPVATPGAATPCTSAAGYKL